MEIVQEEVVKVYTSKDESMFFVKDEETKENVFQFDAFKTAIPKNKFGRFKWLSRYDVVIRKMVFVFKPAFNTNYFYLYGDKPDGSLMIVKCIHRLDNDGFFIHVIKDYDLEYLNIGLKKRRWK